jgi:peptide/nickel transport system substrate-binding protein
MLRKGALAFALIGSLAFGALHGTAMADERVLVSALGDNPPHFNRLLTTDVATSTVSAAIFDTLVRLDASYTPVPSLATAWKASPDAKEYTFTIRDGVKWHDGQPLTVDDVGFTLATYLPLTPQISILKNYLDSVTTPDAHTVVVKLKQPFAPFVEAMAGLPIVPKHVYGDGQPIATHPANLQPVGSGPFKFSIFQSGDHVELVRNDDYWGEKPTVDRLVLPIVPDGNARVLALEAGDIQYADGNYIDTSAYQRLAADSRFQSFPALGGVSTVTVHVNTRNGPLANYEVRKALYQALNRKMIAERAYYGYATPSRGPIPAALTWPVSPDVDFNRDLPFDPAAAKAALDKAGFPAGADGKRFSISLAYIAEFSPQAAAANVIKSNLADIGVDVNLIGEEFNIWAQRTYTDHKFDLSMVFYTSYEDPSIGVARVYVCNPDNVAFRNPTGFCDPELDKDFAAASATTDRDQRRAAFANAEKRILGELNTFPVVDTESLSFARKDLWDLEATHKVYPIDWSLAKAK